MSSVRRQQYAVLVQCTALVVSTVSTSVPQATSSLYYSTNLNSGKQPVVRSQQTSLDVLFFFNVVVVKSQYVYIALGAMAYRSPYFCSARSQQSRTRYVVVSSTLLYIYQGVTTLGTLCLNKKAQRLTLPIQICVRRELLYFRSLQYFLRASQLKVGYTTKAGTL